MEPKKNAAYDVHRYRPALLAGSLAFSIAVVIILFEWSVEVEEKTMCRFENSLENTPYFVEKIMRTVHEEKSMVKEQSKSTNYVEVKDLVKEVEKELSILETTPSEAREGIQELPPVQDLPKETIADDSIFICVEKKPEPDGGLQGFYKFLQRNMKYPQKARRDGTEGKVFVEFTVSKTGVLANFKIIKGISEECDNEAKRVLAMSKWEPGKQRGVPVNVRMVQAINFQLQH